VTKSSRRTGAPSGQQAPSHAPSGAPRAGRRDRDRTTAARTPFLERYRGAILGLAVVVGVGLIGGFVFLSATSPSYACSTQFQASNTDSGRLGAVEDDMGRQHIPAGEFVRYTFCPPASGSHINQTGEGPVQARFYGPDDAVGPQGWIHNLEHGSLVVLYKCENGACDDAIQTQLKQFASDFPPSPVCQVARGKIGPVIARFEQMPANYAALVWGRVLYLDTLDTDEILRFYAEEGERTNPEPQCSGASPSPSPSASPAASPSASPAGSASPQPSASPSPESSAAPSTSPSPSPS
jgi:hypothetical protein